MFSFNKLKKKNKFKLVEGRIQIGHKMIDVVAHDCITLVESLNKLPGEQEKLSFIEEYLQDADILHQPIAEFPEDLDWFNVTEPLLINDSLQGKIVVLDFWTYCCINCIHMLPDLKLVEEKNSVESGVVIIGVHSPKFESEKDSANILSAIQRHKITHPVVNDHGRIMWKKFEVECWPTLLILGPRGNPIFIIMGEGHLDRLELYLKAAKIFYTQKETLKLHSLPLNSSTELIRPSILRFPSKICCIKLNDEDENSIIYAISDSGNNRILIVDSKGKIIHKIGGKASGFEDGDFTTAKFNCPLGVSFLNEFTLFVADSANHAIRKITLNTETVTTVVGNGIQSKDKEGGKIGKLQQLSSPWDVLTYRTRNLDMSFHIDESKAPTKDMLFIAMAGLHQIWALFLEDTVWWKLKKYKTGQCVSIAGTGVEESRNNVYPHKASFAQPSGLTISKDAKELYVCDSESSTIRRVQLSDGRTSGVVGGDRNPTELFAFGDSDGKLNKARFQHPLGIAYNSKNKLLYLADSYNNKIKAINADLNEVTSLLLKDNKNSTEYFNEPGGLCMHPDGNTLLVCNTNNHSVEMIDLENMEVTPFKLFFEDVEAENKNFGDIYDYKRVLHMASSGGKLLLKIKMQFENEMKLMEQAPQKWKLNTPNEFWVSNEMMGQMESTRGLFLEICVPSQEINKKAEEFLTVTFKMNVCLIDMCIPHVFSIRIPVTYSDELMAPSVIDSLITVNVNSKTDITVV